jgi:hypothetical protein
MTVKKGSKFSRDRLMACPLNIEQEVDVSIQPSVAEASLNVI